MTNSFALTLFSLSFIAGSCAAILTILELPERLRALRQPPAPDPARPTISNEHLDTVRALLAARSPQMTALETRGALNDIIFAIGEETSARKADVDRLARLVAVPQGTVRLFAAVALVVAASILGGLGDLASILNWHLG